MPYLIVTNEQSPFTLNLVYWWILKHTSRNAKLKVHGWLPRGYSSPLAVRLPQRWSHLVAPWALLCPSQDGPCFVPSWSQGVGVWFNESKPHRAQSQDYENLQFIPEPSWGPAWTPANSSQGQEYPVSYFVLVSVIIPVCCDPMDSSLRLSIQFFEQVYWKVTISSLRESSRPGDQPSPGLAGGFFTLKHLKPQPAPS